MSNARCVNKVILIGNLVADPELSQTSGGVPVSNLTLATNRRYKNKEGEEKEQADFHRLVAFGELANICAQFLKKGSKAYFEGRLQNKEWQSEDGTTRHGIDIVIEQMIVLDKKEPAGELEVI